MLINFKDKNSLLLFSKAKKKYDIQIIGAGIIGISISNFLLKYKSNLKILLIERGRFINNAQAKKQNNSVNFKGLSIKGDSRVFGVGGSSLTWGNIISNITNDELSNKWPINAEAIDRYCKDVSNILNLAYSTKDKNLKKNERYFSYPIQPVNFKSYLNTSKIDLLYNCNVDKVCEENKCCISIFKNQKKEIKIKSSQIILSLGTLEVIKLLHNSIKSKYLPKVNKKILGKYFMNHPKFNIGEIKFLKKNIYIKKFLLKKNDHHFSYIGISLPKKIKKKFDLLNSYVSFKPKIYSELENKINSSKNNLYKLKNRALLKMIKLIDYFNFFLNKRQFLMKAFLEMEPKKENQVKIDKNNKIKVFNFISNKEIKTIKILRDYILKKYSSDYLKEEKKNITKKFIYKYAQDASHHMGGTIYDHKIKNSFVDKNLKIIGSKNIFICSSSFFPTSGSVNPTIIILAFALRLSKHILKTKKI